MTSRIPRLLSLAGLLGASLVALSSTTPSSAAPADWCDVDETVPCIVSAYRGAMPLDQNDIIVDTYGDPFEANHNTGFTILGLDSGDLGVTYTVMMRTHIKPRVISMTGGYVSTSRFLDDGQWYAVVSVTPVEILESCDGNPDLGEPLCPETAEPEDVQIQVQGNINDAYWYSDVDAERDQLHGLDQFSNINLFWYPPTIVTSSLGVLTMDFLMENSHFYPDGVTEFQGFANVRLPNRVLREFYGIPNPETMVDGSFTGSAGTGTFDSEQELGADAWLIDATGITFSKRHLKMTRGVIVPTKPTNVVGDRTDTTHAKVKFTLSSPRGANVTGYLARCESPGGHVVSKLKTSPSSPVKLAGLRSGVPYSCKVRAKSKAGYGPWSAATSVTGQVPH